LDHRESGDSQIVERELADSAKPTEDKHGQAQDRAQLRGWRFGFLETPTLQIVISEEEWGQKA
jgi:hypothetical protein